jgi:hypothetical protein
MIPDDHAGHLPVADLPGDLEGQGRALERMQVLTLAGVHPAELLAAWTTVRRSPASVAASNDCRRNVRASAVRPGVGLDEAKMVEGDAHGRQVLGLARQGQVPSGDGGRPL